MATTAASTPTSPPVGHTVNTVAIVFGVITICVIAIRLYGRIVLVRAVGADDGSLDLAFTTIKNNTDTNRSLDRDCKCTIIAAELS